MTIDAMGCQVEIAREIVDAEADYCLSAKDNQPTLYAGLKKHFDKHLEDDFARTKVRRHETEEQGTRPQRISLLLYLSRARRSAGSRALAKLRAIGVVLQPYATRRQAECEADITFSAKYLSGQRFAEAVRGHWGIENRFALATRRDVSGRSMPHPQESRRRGIQHAAAPPRSPC